MYALIVSAVFPPEPVVSAQTSAQIVDALVRRQHQVTVIAPFPSKPAGKLYPGYRRRLFQREGAPQGFDVIRCFSTLAPESRLRTRLVENLTFGMTSSWAVLRAKRPDVIYANSWPIIATGLLALTARLYKIPLVISVQDVYPESIISQQRAQANGWPVRLMRRMDTAIARSCHAIIVIADRFACLYRNDRRVPSERVHCIPNWIDSQSVVVDDPRAAQFRERLGIPPQAVVVAYGGNVGMAAGVETVVESFSGQKDTNDLYLVIAGEGSQLTACQMLAVKTNNPRIKFYTPWPKDETSMLLSAADVLILPTRGQQSLASVPSKLITYMLAARPVIALALRGSDVAEVIGQSGCGWLVEPDQPAQLAAKLREVMSLPTEERAKRGQAGRDYALKHFTQETCVPEIIQIIENAVMHPGQATA